MRSEVAEQKSRRERAAGLLTLPPVHRVARLLPLHPGLVILNYHRIAEPASPPLDRGLWSATPAQFASQLRLLQREFDVISVADLRDALNAKRGRRVLITFDDGYRDNYEHALPALRSAGLPAIFFLSTGFLDSPRLAWWDEIAWMVRRSEGPEPEAEIVAATNRYKGLPGDRGEDFLDEIAERTGAGRAPSTLGAKTWMSWDMVREMRDLGMAFGGHTVNHPVLARLPREQQESELDGCRSRLRDELGVEMDLFSYPVGLRDCFDETTRDLLRTRQVRFAFSNYGGYEPAKATADPLDLKRTNVGRGTSPALFRSIVERPRAFAKW